MRPGLIWRGVLLVLVAASAAVAQPVAIVGGTVYPVSGPPIENGTVLIDEGRIAAVGASVVVPDGARRVDAAGKWVTPGLIHGASGLGVVEIGAVPESNDASAGRENGVAAAFRVWDGLNPETVLWAPARNEGVTSVVVVPGAGLLSGQGAFVDLADGTRDDVVRRAPVAMYAWLGASGVANTTARGELVQRFRELIEDVQAFVADPAAYDRGSSRGLSARRIDLQAMAPVVAGELPLVVRADRAADILTVLDLAAEYGLRVMILGGAEAWKVAGRLAEADVAVLTGALDNIPSSFASLGARQENLALLRQAGVTVAIVGAVGDAFNVRNIRQEAGNAVAYGLSWDEALRAVTLAPAELFGVGSDVGSLDVGRVANVVVWSGDPFEFATTADHVFVHGEDVKAASRQDLLMQRYRPRP